MDELFNYNVKYTGGLGTKKDIVTYSLIGVMSGLIFGVLADGFKFTTIELIVFFVLLAIVLYFQFFTREPQNKIIVTPKALIVNKHKEDSLVLNLNEIESFSSSTGLNIELKSGKSFTLSYAEWIMPKQKVKELNKAIGDILNSKKYS